MEPLRVHRWFSSRDWTWEIIPHLKWDKLLTGEEYDYLTRCDESSARRNLLNIMFRKGRIYFEHYCKNLVWSGQMESAKQIGVYVDNIPPDPYESGE